MTTSSYASIRPLLWLVSLAIFMQMLDSTIVNTALPAMARSLGESPLQMQSVVFSYALAVATFIPASGWIADRFGTRRTFLVAIILFTLGSLACALAQTLHQLVGARVRTPANAVGDPELLGLGLQWFFEWAFSNDNQRPRQHRKGFDRRMEALVIDQSAHAKPDGAFDVVDDLPLNRSCEGRRLEQGLDVDAKRHDFDFLFELLQQR
jgi:hypothetical protein